LMSNRIVTILGSQLFLLCTLCILLSITFSTGKPASTYRPVVLMHGIYRDAAYMNTTKGWILSDFPGIYVHNMEIGNGPDDSIFMNINDQVASFAHQVAKDPQLKDGFNLVCHRRSYL